MLRSQRIRWFSSRSTAASKLAAAILAVGVGIGFVSQAAAQITTEVLIGDAVTDPGTKYADVDEAIKRFNNRDPLGAQQFLEAALRKNPNLPPVDLLLAKMYSTLR